MRGCHDAWKSCVVGDKQNGYLDAYDIYITNKKTVVSSRAAFSNVMDVPTNNTNTTYLTAMP